MRAACRALMGLIAASVGCAADAPRARDGTAEVDTGAEADVGDADGVSSGLLTFAIATHALNEHRPQSTKPVEDRSALEVVVGAQGLKMAVLVPRVAEPLTLPIVALAELESGPVVLGRVERELEPPHQDTDGAWVFHDLFLLIAPELQVPDDWARLRVVLTDGAGRTGEVRRTVRLVLPPTE